jgi:hypothetical protein
MHNCNEYVVPHGKDISERVNNYTTTNYDGKANIFGNNKENNHNITTKLLLFKKFVQPLPVL